MKNEMYNAELRLAQAVDGLSAEQIGTVTRFFQPLVSPETHDSAAAFADRILSGEQLGFADVEDFCAAQ